jgi:hypothetical protein
MDYSLTSFSLPVLYLCGIVPIIKDLFFRQRTQKYEKHNNKSTADRINKFQAAQNDHDEVYFICTSSNQKELSEILVRGSRGIEPSCFQAGDELAPCNCETYP